MVRVSSPAKLRPWSELTTKMVMGVVPGLVTYGAAQKHYIRRKKPEDGVPGMFPVGSVRPIP